MFYMDVAKVDRDVTHVASVLRYIAVVIENVSFVFSLMLQQVFSCCKLQCFIWMLHMFDTYIASVYSKYFFCFRRMLHSSVSCCKCLMVFGESRGAVSDGRTDGGRDARARRRTGAGYAGDRRGRAMDRGGLLESPVAPYASGRLPMLVSRNGRPGASMSVKSISVFFLDLESDTDSVRCVKYGNIY
jgi:hypothetical protein